MANGTAPSAATRTYRVITQLFEGREYTQSFSQKSQARKMAQMQARAPANVVRVTVEQCDVIETVLPPALRRVQNGTNGHGAIGKAVEPERKAS